MANKQRHAIAPLEAGQLHRLPVTITDRTVSLPVDSRLSLSWIGKSRSRMKVLWRMNTDGTATGLNAEEHLETLLAAGEKDPELMSAIRTQFSLGQFHPEDRLILPDPVIAHVTGTVAPETTDVFWIQTEANRIELMTTKQFEKRLSDADELISALLEL